MNGELQNWRSLLFVAANDATRIAKAHTREADAIILDLEDAIPPSAKPAARARLANAIETLTAAGQKIVVRINADDIAADLEVAVRADVSALMAPKVEDPAALAALIRAVRDREAAAGLTPSRIGVIALIESPRGVTRSPAIGEVDDVAALAFGSEDFALGMGVEPTPEVLDLPCRMVALVAAAAGRPAFGVPVSIAAFADEAVFTEGVELARRIGMTGALCIHPRQVAAANLAFSPTTAERAQAMLIVAADDASRGGVTVLDGRMIDRPVVERAWRLLQRP